MFNVYLLCGTSLIAVTPLLQFTLLIAKTLNENTNYFRRLESAFRQLFCLKSSLKLVTFSKSYTRKQK